jgi:hypothetical protein
LVSDFEGSILREASTGELLFTRDVNHVLERYVERKQNIPWSSCLDVELIGSLADLPTSCHLGGELRWILVRDVIAARPIPGFPGTADAGKECFTW